MKRRTSETVCFAINNIFKSLVVISHSYFFVFFCHFSKKLGSNSRHANATYWIKISDENDMKTYIEMRRPYLIN